MKKNFSKIFNTGESKLVSLWKFATFLLTRPGRELIKKMVVGQPRAAKPINYSAWLQQQVSDALKTGRQSAQPVKISVAISVCDADVAQLVAAIKSVQAQQYEHWELLIEDAWPDRQVLDLARADKRIKLIYRVENRHIPACANTVLTATEGSYVLLMAQNDLLDPACLQVLAAYVHEHPQTAIIYTDDDLTAEDGSFYMSHFKPAWSPHTLLSRNYIGHNLLVKKELLLQIPGLRDGFRYPGFYDLVLRLTEMAPHIAHIPLVLFHRRTPTFADTNDQLSKQALSEALQRRGLTGVVNNTDLPGCYHIAFDVQQKDKVSIIIPTKDNVALLQKTIGSILQRTDYPNYEILLLNNNSRSKEFFSLVKGYEQQYSAQFRCIDANFPFNFAKLMNLGAKEAAGTYLLFCNNDIEVLQSDWMTQMVANAQQPQTGAVGVKLLFPDDTIQHAGIVLGGATASSHIFAHAGKDNNGYYGSLAASTNYAAVTAACLMCRKQAFEQVGGMDETLAVEYNDVDLCLRFLQQGYYNVLLPSVVLYHYESATRGHPFRNRRSWKQHETELSIFKGHWQQFINNDPYYNIARELPFTYTPARA